MPIILHHAASERESFPMVDAALRRSFTNHGVGIAGADNPDRDFPNAVQVYIQPGPDDLAALSRLVLRGGKAMVFGPAMPEVEEEMLPLLGLRRDGGLPSLAGADECTACVNEHHTESSGRVVHAKHYLNVDIHESLRQRPFTRYDYADEWNNLGFGRIRTDGSCWAATSGLRADKAVELSGLHLSGPQGSGQESVHAGAYMTLFDGPDWSILWCGRPVGPVDSVEWSVVERFVSDWRCGQLPSLPTLLQAPHGCRCLVTMRLDCDEDVSSSDGLFRWYRDRNIPFSLAVKTSLDMDAADLDMLVRVRDAGGSVVSHSHNHLAGWGGDEAEAFREAERSSDWIAGRLPGHAGRFLAVSPFHSNPVHAIRALERAGYMGVATGIIHRDPEYLLGRAGLAPHTRGRIAVSNQQSMLHGDSFRRQGESVEVHVQAFAAQYAARGVFGFLDHPFSGRYRYDWESETQRQDAHGRLLTAISAYPGVRFVSQEGCFDFIRALMNVELDVENGRAVARGEGLEQGFRFQCRFGGRVMPLPASEEG